MDDATRRVVEQANGSSKPGNTQRPNPQPQPQYQQQQPSQFSSPLDALAFLAVTPEVQEAFRNAWIGHLLSGCYGWAQNAAETKVVNDRNYRAKVEEQKQEILKGQDDELNKLARQQAEAELGYYGMGKQPYTYIQTQTQVSPNCLSTTTTIAALNGSSGGKN